MRSLTNLSPHEGEFYNNNLLMSLVQGDVAIEKLQAEIDQSKVLVAAKYKTAQDSMDNLKEPSVTANLFETAQNEALILEEDEKQLKIFQELQASVRGTIVKKSDEIVTELNSLLQELNDQVILQQEKGAADIQSGLIANIQVCRYGVKSECVEKGKEGITQFQKGVNDVVVAQDKFNRVLRDFDGELR